ncbi:MAG: hypothetical protein Q4C75_02885 [Bergeyella zoohelcum]|nr:hypothetical protein [Bergeyella zoohelcum]
MKLIKMNFIKFLFIGILGGVLLVSCRNDDGAETTSTSTQTAFDIQNYFVAGTIGLPNKSTYAISFLEKNKAIVHMSSADFIGEYTFVAGKSLVVEVKDPANYRIFKLALDADNKVQLAYYQALQMAYVTTGNFFELKANNQLAGKTFKGIEYKMGGKENGEKNYTFSTSGTSYLYDNETENRSVELINNSVFRYKGNKISELGFVAGDSLTTFRTQGIYYFGTFKQQ